MSAYRRSPAAGAGSKYGGVARSHDLTSVPTYYTGGATRLVSSSGVPRRYQVYSRNDTPLGCANYDIVRRAGDGRLTGARLSANRHSWAGGGSTSLNRAATIGSVSDVRWRSDRRGSGAAAGQHATPPAAPAVTSQPATADGTGQPSGSQDGTTETPPGDSGGNTETNDGNTDKTATNDARVSALSPACGARPPRKSETTHEASRTARQGAGNISHCDSASQKCRASSSSSELSSLSDTKNLRTEPAAQECIGKSQTVGPKNTSPLQHTQVSSFVKPAPLQKSLQKNKTEQKKIPQAPLGVVAGAGVLASSVPAAKLQPKQASALHNSKQVTNVKCADHLNRRSHTEDKPVCRKDEGQSTDSICAGKTINTGFESSKATEEEIVQFTFRLPSAPTVPERASQSTGSAAIALSKAMKSNTTNSAANTTVIVSQRASENIPAWGGGGDGSGAAPAEVPAPTHHSDPINESVTPPDFTGDESRRSGEASQNQGRGGTHQSDQTVAHAPMNKAGADVGERCIPAGLPILTPDTGSSKFDSCQEKAAEETKTSSTSASQDMEVSQNIGQVEEEMQISYWDSLEMQDNNQHSFAEHKHLGRGHEVETKARILPAKESSSSNTSSDKEYTEESEECTDTSSDSSFGSAPNSMSVCEQDADVLTAAEPWRHESSSGASTGNSESFSDVMAEVKQSEEVAVPDSHAVSPEADTLTPNTGREAGRDASEESATQANSNFTDTVHETRAPFQCVVLQKDGNGPGREPAATADAQPGPPDVAVRSRLSPACSEDNESVDIDLTQSGSSSAEESGSNDSESDESDSDSSESDVAPLPRERDRLVQKTVSSVPSATGRQPSPSLTRSFTAGFVTDLPEALSRDWGQFAVDSLSFREPEQWPKASPIKTLEDSSSDSTSSRSSPQSSSRGSSPCSDSRPAETAAAYPPPAAGCFTPRPAVPVPLHTISEKAGVPEPAAAVAPPRQRRRPPAADAEVETAAMVARRQRRIRRTASSPEVGDLLIRLEGERPGAPRNPAPITPLRRRIVLAQQAQVKPKDEATASSVHERLLPACITLNEAQFRELMAMAARLASSATINQTDASGRTPLSHLCMHGNGRCVEEFSRLPYVDANIADRDGNTALHFAAQAGHAAVVSALLENYTEIEVDAKNRQGLTPLMKACVQGKSKCAKLLLEHGGDPQLRDPARQLTCTQWAYFCGRHGCARLVEAHLLAHNGSASDGQSLKRVSSEPDLQPTAGGAAYNAAGGAAGWLRTKFRRLLGRGESSQAASPPAHRRRPSLPSDSDCGGQTVAAPPRLTPAVPTILVQQVEVEVDPLVVLYGDSSPPGQRSRQENQVGEEAGPAPPPLPPRRRAAVPLAC